MKIIGLHLSFTNEIKKTKHYCIKLRAVCIHCVKEKCQHMAGSRDQDVDRRACAVQTTAPIEKGTTRWPLSNIPWHHPLVASTPQEGGSGVHSRPVYFCLSSKLQERNRTRDACLASSSPRAGQCLHPCPRGKQSTVLDFTSDQLLKAPRQDSQSVRC